MTAHIALPRVAEAKDVPATLSTNILTNVLRKELGFRGVVAGPLVRSSYHAEKLAGRLA